MNKLYKVTRTATKVLIQGVHYHISDFHINFNDGTHIEFCDMNDVVERNGEYIIYTNSKFILKYAHRTIEAYYKSKNQ